MPLAERRPVVEHVREALVEAVAAERPALEARLQEPRRDVLVRLVGEPVGGDEDPVLERARADVRHLDHVQLVELVELVRLRVLLLEHLRELVVGHRRGGVDLAVQEQVHVERLRHDLRVLLRVDPVLRQRGEELVLVPAEPDADLLIAEVVDRVDAAVLERDLGHARAGEDLGDVDDLLALVAGREQVVEPVDPELRLAAEHGLLRDDVRAAGPDRDVEAGVVVEALLLGRVVAGELGLRDPLQLQRHLVGRLALLAARLAGGRGRPPASSSSPPQPATASTSAASSAASNHSLRPVIPSPPS